MDEVNGTLAAMDAVRGTLERATLAVQGSDPAGIQDAAYKILEHKGDLGASSACDRWAPSQKLAAARLAAAADSFSHYFASNAALLRSDYPDPNGWDALGAQSEAAFGLLQEGTELAIEASYELPAAARAEVVRPPMG